MSSIAGTEARIGTGKPDSNRGRRRALDWIRAGVLAGAIGILLFAWFSPFNYHTLMGDDLLLLNTSRQPGGFVNGLWSSLGQTGAGKYRPVLQLVLAVTTDHFGGSFLSYKILNTLLLLICCLLVARITYRASRGSWVVATASAMVLALSRFNLYYVLQGLGVMEGLALMFFLIVMVAVQELFDSRDLRWLAVADLSFFLLVYTHERFLALTPAIAVVSYLALANRPVRVRSVWACIPIAIFFSNFVVKAWVLHIDFFTGTGGEKVHLTFRTVGHFMLRGVINVLGYNSGPDYLSGRDAHLLGLTAVILAAAFGVPALVLLAWAWVGRPEFSLERSHSVLLRRGVLAFLFFVPLVGTASIGSRQEWRWLYAPFALVMLGVAYGLGNLARHRTLQVMGCLVVFAASLSVDGYYRQYARSTYFFGGQDTAESVNNLVVQAHRRELKDTTVFVVSHGDAIFTDWFMGGGAFAAVYAKGLDPDIRFVNAFSDIPGAKNVRSVVRVYDFEGDRVVETASPTA